MLDHLKTLGYSEADVIEVGLALKNDNGRVYDRFRNRLIIPIRDERGRVIGFGARALAAEDNPKYLNSPQTVLFDKSRTLFGLDTAKTTIREIETAVIVEGYMDAIQAQQAGFKNVVAQMGTAMTETQLRLLTRSAKRIVLALDRMPPDRTRPAAAWKQHVLPCKPISVGVYRSIFGCCKYRARKTPTT